MSLAKKVNPGSRVDLSRVNSSADAGMEKEQSEAKLAELAMEINQLQDLLYAACDRALLIVLQGMDTSGKDGTIRSVFRYVDPLGCRVASFKVPTPIELKHDFLWRAHQQAPEHGIIAIFNRSHYEDVLIVRVKNLIGKEVWSKRYDQINKFEELLAETGTIVLKFYLHISKAEQESRLLAREEDVAKAWKLSAGDWIEGELWDSYMRAYEVALAKCSTEAAPWYIVPANHKWYRDLVIAETIVGSLRPLKKGWLEALTALGKTQLEEVRKVRAETESGGGKKKSRKKPG